MVSIMFSLQFHQYFSPQIRLCKTKTNMDNIVSEFIVSFQSCIGLSHLHHNFSRHQIMVRDFTGRAIKTVWVILPN
jgi:hypothetical protein